MNPLPAWIHLSGDLRDGFHPRRIARGDVDAWLTSLQESALLARLFAARERDVGLHRPALAGFLESVVGLPPLGPVALAHPSDGQLQARAQLDSVELRDAKPLQPARGDHTQLRREHPSLAVGLEGARERDHVARREVAEEGALLLSAGPRRCGVVAQEVGDGTIGLDGRHLRKLVVSLHGAFHPRLLPLSDLPAQLVGGNGAAQHRRAYAQCVLIRHHAGRRLRPAARLHPRGAHVERCAPARTHESVLDAHEARTLAVAANGLWIEDRNASPTRTLPSDSDSDRGFGLIHVP